MFDRPKSGERAILVLAAATDMAVGEELRELAESAGAEVVGVLTHSKTTVSAKYFIGSGKAAELAELVATESAELVIINHAITPAQERNLEREIKCRVLDRAGLILDIFAQRARSFEGQLQVELAQLKHISTRLIRGWTHLERQKGGIGLRGPGETQLEVDRRLIKGRIQYIMHRLERVQQQRLHSRTARNKANVPTVALVGYTNVGKSSLFNKLTNAHAFVKDQLFATLDPTLRKLQLPTVGTVILVDTVGFISDLPHELIEAFKATLEETREADLLLHVSDCSSPNSGINRQEVIKILNDIGAGSLPVIEVFNKADLLPGPVPIAKYNIVGAAQRPIPKIWISSLTGEGLEDLEAAIIGYLTEDKIHETLILGSDAADVRAYLYRASAVLHEEVNEEDGSWILDIAMRRQDWQRACGKFPMLRSISGNNNLNPG